EPDDVVAPARLEPLDLVPVEQVVRRAGHGRGVDRGREPDTPERRQLQPSARARLTRPQDPGAETFRPAPRGKVARGPRGMTVPEFRGKITFELGGVTASGLGEIIAPGPGGMTGAGHGGVALSGLGGEIAFEAGGEIVVHRGHANQGWLFG